MLNKGLVGAEIAEEIVLPPALESAWSTRGYYGSVSHNVKAIYQRYLGWCDGNPVHLWEHVRRSRRPRGTSTSSAAPRSEYHRRTELSLVRRPQARTRRRAAMVETAAAGRRTGSTGTSVLPVR